MKRLGVILLPLDGMLVHRRSFPHNLLGFPNNSPVTIYIPGWREALWELSVLPKNTTLCPRPGLEPGPFAPGTSALGHRDTQSQNTIIITYPLDLTHLLHHLGIYIDNNALHCCLKTVHSTRDVMKEGHKEDSHGGENTFSLDKSTASFLK